MLSSCHIGLSKLEITPTNLSPSVIFHAADFVSCGAAGSVIWVVTNQSLLIVCFYNRLSRHLGHAYWRTCSQSIHHKMATVRSVIANLLRMITAVITSVMITGTTCRLNCNNVILSCNLSGVWRLFSLGRGTTALCDLRKLAPYRNSLTYLLTYLLTVEARHHFGF